MTRPIVISCVGLAAITIGGVLWNLNRSNAVAPVTAPSLAPPSRSAPTEAESADPARLGDRSASMFPAMAGAAGHPPPAGPSVDLSERARRWAQRDLAGALQWLGTLEGAERRIAAEAVMAEIARTDPRGALEAAEFFGAGLDSGQAEHAAQIWAEEAPAEATAWVRSRPAGVFRDRLAARIGTVLAARAPEAAAQLVAETVGAPAREAALLAVVRQWAASDPVGATAYANRFSDLSLRLGALREIEVARRQLASR